MTIDEEIKRRAELFCKDNAFLQRHISIIESAMLIGASVVLEQGPDILPGEDDATLRMLFQPKYDGYRGGPFDFHSRPASTYVGE